MFDPSPAVASELSRHLLVGVRRSSRYYHQTVPHSRHHRSRLTGSRNGVILCCSKGEESARCRRREHHAVAARARQSEVRTTPKMFVCCFLVVLLRFSKPLCRSQRYINGFQSYANKSDRFAPAFFFVVVGVRGLWLPGARVSTQASHFSTPFEAAPAGRECSSGATRRL